MPCYQLKIAGRFVFGESKLYSKQLYAMAMHGGHACMQSVSQEPHQHISKEGMTVLVTMSYIHATLLV